MLLSFVVDVDVCQVLLMFLLFLLLAVNNVFVVVGGSVCCVLMVVLVVVWRCRCFGCRCSSSLLFLLFVVGVALFVCS